MAFGPGFRIHFEPSAPSFMRDEAKPDGLDDMRLIVMEEMGGPTGVGAMDSNFFMKYRRDK